MRCLPPSVRCKVILKHKEREKWLISKSDMPAPRRHETRTSCGGDPCCSQPPGRARSRAHTRNGRKLVPDALLCSGSRTFALKEENAVTIMTPNAKAHEGLSALASRYVDVGLAAVGADALQGRRPQGPDGGQGDGPDDGADALCPGRQAARPRAHRARADARCWRARSPTTKASPPPATTSGARPAAGTTRTRPTAPSPCRSS